MPSPPHDAFFTRRLAEHLLSLVLVSTLFLALIVYFHSRETQRQTLADARIEQYLQLDFLDFNNPLHKSLFRETLDIYYPEQKARNDSLVRAIESYRARQILAKQRQGRSRSLTASGRPGQLAMMFARFLIAYVIVMALTYYGVQTLATLRFIRMKQGKTSYIAALLDLLMRATAQHNSRSHEAIAAAPVLLGKALLKGALYFLLFSPAYVIAYSFKTRFDTDSFMFLILLGVISNGLLITYAQKFYTFLVSESRKGYVQTAIVKNLERSYDQPSGIAWRNILDLRKHFPGHVFDAIYQNANYQYMATIKEQASFLITGLVIIEMALNLQGYLSYELLQNLLYQQYDVALTILLGIFVMVKGSEILTDYRISRFERKYANEE